LQLQALREVTSAPAREGLAHEDEQRQCGRVPSHE
jgi:hypothetical protein